MAEVWVVNIQESEELKVVSMFSASGQSRANCGDIICKNEREAMETCAEYIADGYEPRGWMAREIASQS
jgi:hypothetical protein